MADSHVLIFAVIGHNTINIPDMFKVFTIFKPPMQTSVVVDPYLQIRGGGVGGRSSRPWDKGKARSRKKFFPVLRPQFGLKIGGGGRSDGSATGRFLGHVFFEALRTSAWEATILLVWQH